MYRKLYFYKERKQMFKKKYKLLSSFISVPLVVSTITLSASCDGSKKDENPIDTKPSIPETNDNLIKPFKLVLNTDESGTLGMFKDENNRTISRIDIQNLIEKKIKDIVNNHVANVKSDKIFDSWSEFDFENKLGYSLKEMWPDLKIEFVGDELKLDEPGQLYLNIVSEISYPDTDTVIKSFNKNTSSLKDIKQTLRFQIVFRSGSKIVVIRNTDFLIDLVQEKSFKSIAEVENSALGQEKFRPVNIDWNSEIYKPLVMKGKIVSISDGDTATIKLTEVPTKFEETYSVGSEYKVRIASIDTPEKAVGSGSSSVKSKPFEYTFAEWSTKFAEENLMGQDVVFWSNGEEDAYKRLVGDFFINKKDNPNGNYQYSYSAEIVRAGLTLPYDTKSENFRSTYQSDKTAYKTQIYPIIAEAAEEAYINQNGFYKFVSNPFGIQKTIYRNKENSGWDLFFRRSVFTNRGDLYEIQPKIPFSILDWIKELENNKEK